MPPARFLILLLVLVVLAVVGRRQVAATLSATRGAMAAHLKEAGWIHLGALSAIFVAGVLIRLKYLHTPMRWDESFTFVSYGQHDLGQALALYDSPNNHTFHTMLMHWSYALFGMGESSLRLPVFVAGSLMSPALYVATLRLFGRHAALLAAAFAAVAPQLVEYATNARGYEIAALLAVLLLATAPSLLRSAAPVPWVLFVLIAALGLYTVPVFAYALAVIAGTIGLSALIGGTDQDKPWFLVRLAVAGVASVAVAAWMYGPILDEVWHYMQGSNYAKDGWDYMGQVFDAWTRGVPVWAQVVAIAGLVSSAVTLGRYRGRPFPIVIVVVVFVAAVVVLGRVVPLTRVWLPLLPIVAAATAGGLVALARFAADRIAPLARAFTGRRADYALTAVAVVIAVALGVRAIDQHLTNFEGSALPSAGAIAQDIRPQFTANDRVLITNNALPMLWFEFVRYGMPYQVVQPQLAAGAAAPAGGHTYVVVMTGLGETLPAVLQQNAPDSGLRPDATVVGKFPEATLYQLKGSPAS